MKSIILLLLSLFVFLTCGAANYQFRHFDMNSGLSQNTVFSIAQDKMGFMWFATKDGLNRFDGHTFRIYRYENTPYSLGSDYVNCIFVANDQCIWVGTTKGVYIYSPVTDSFEKFVVKAQNGMIIKNNVNLFSGQGNEIYISSQQQGLFRYNLQSKRLTWLAHTNFPTVTSIAIGHDGQIWFSQFGGGLYITDHAFRKLQVFNNRKGQSMFDGKTITGIIFAEQDQMFVSTEQNGLWEVNIRTHELKQLISMKSDKGKYVHNILRNGNEIWAATEDGLYVYEMLTHELKHFKYEPTNPFSISDNALQCLFRDRDGGMWLGSYFGGCYYAPNYSYLFDKFIPMIDVPNSLHGRHVREMVEDRLGQIWIGTEDGGLNKYNPHTNQFSHIQISNDFSNIHGMCLMGDELWVGTFAYGLRVINIATGKLMKTYNTTTHPARLYDNNVFSLCNANGRIYVGLLSGLYIYDRNSKTFKRVGGLPQNIVYDIMNDRNGNLWVSIDGEGVYKWSDANHRWTKYTTQNQRITSDNVLCIFNSSNGQIWASTEGKGVCRYNTRTDRFEKVDIPKYQPRRVVYQILEDHNGRLWLTSNDGLICYNPPTQESKIFTVANGLLENSFNYNSSLLSSDGRIYLGSLNGFVSFHPGAMREVNTKPNIVATDFFLNNAPVGPQTKDSPLKQSITLTKRIELPNNANSFSLALAVLPYNNLQQFQLEYKLEGFDKDWLILNDGNLIKYTNIPAGHYRLLARIYPDSDHASSNTYELEVVVNPPLYLTWWAILFYLLFAGVMVYLAYRYLNQRSEMRRRLAMEKFEYEKEQELYQSKINFFTNVAHEIRTPLTLIKGPLEDILHHDLASEDEKDDLDIMDQNVSRLLDLTNQLLNFRKTEQNGLRLNFEKSNINSLVNSVFIRFTPLMKTRGIKYEISLTSSSFYAYVDQEAFTKIISNLINNAVKYCDQLVKVQLLSGTDHFDVLVINDGSLIPKETRELIFKPFYRSKTASISSTQGTGIGLALSRTLTELHGGTLVVEDDIKFNVLHLSLPVVQRPSLEMANSPFRDIAVEDPDDQDEDLPSDGLPTVLIVEDNLQLLEYEKTKLQHSYHILTATDGQKAVEILNQHYVDLILSDVMMEPMDGFELCRRVKEDVNSSHIPFVLLTALTLDSAKVKGMECGADSYIEKPFSMDYLLSVIRNLLHSRENIKKAFANSPFTLSDSVIVSKVDDVFQKRLEKVMEEHLTDSDFGINEFAEAMCMSKTNLNRKMRGAFNLTPNNYIKLERLKKAAILMKSEDCKVNEVCYRVGFSSPSYFTQCFYKQFGLLPKDFIC